jgi:uncharacterized phage protein (TIGR01671 family)
MREIEFRAWHKKRKKMYEVLHLHIKTIMNGGQWVTCKGFDIIEQKDIHIQIQPGDFELLQYTGMKDRNGVKIFEGDIIKLIINWPSLDNEGNEIDSCEKIIIGDVRILPSIGAVIHVSKQSGDNCYTTDIDGKRFENKAKYKNIRSRRCEVIGNIHEHPELLK